MSFCRRTFLGSALFFTLPVASAATPIAGPTAARGLLVVGDSSIPGSAGFLKSWSSAEAQRLGFNGNIGALLMKMLVPTWRQRPAAPIAGLTDLRAFFCLSQMAADHGLMLVHRHVHGPVDGPAGLPLIAQHPTDWSSQAAHGVKQALSTPAGRRALPISELLPGNQPVPVSWLMLPRDALRI
jgi:hypothetical protein